MGGVGNGVMEEFPDWHLNKKVGLHLGRGQCRTTGDNLRQTRTMQDHDGTKWLKGLSLVDPEEGPHGFGLRTGDHRQHS